MCGIVGIVTRKNNGFYQQDLEVFQGMLVNDSQRGEDSTGVAVVENTGNVQIVKIASHPFHLFELDSWSKFRSDAFARGRILIGHNRKATQGEINSQNAHPFHEGDIVMVHNGTLYKSYYEGLKTGKAVDSHALTVAFNEKGAENVIPEIQGAFALVWYNLRTGMLHLCRNDARPLSILRTKDTIAFASEAWMPYGQFLRRGEKVEESYQLEPGMLYTIDPATGGITTKKLELYKAPPPTTTVYSSSNLNDGRFQHGRYPHGYRGGWGGDDADDNMMDDPIPPADRRLLPLASPRRKESPFAVGNIVQVVIDRARVEQNHGSGTGEHMIKIYGTAFAETGEEADCCGWLPNTAFGEIAKWSGSRWAVGEVKSIVGSACGDSLWLKDLELDDMKDSYTEQVGSWSWDMVISKGCCSKCDEQLDKRDLKFTSVRRQGKAWRIICNKCVEAALEGDYRENFVKRRDAAVQARVEQRQESGTGTQPAIQVAGPSTVQ